MIPKVAHVIWLGNPMRQHLRKLVKGFEDLHPDWEIRWWSESEIDAFHLTNQYVYDHASDYVPDDSVYQFRSDVARYEIVYRQGGVYFDPDFRWQRSLDEYLDTDFVIPWEIDGKFVANGLIGSVPGHPVLLDMIVELRDRIQKRPRKDLRANRITGTHVLTPLVRKYGIDPLPQHLFCPAPWNRPDLTDNPALFPDAVAVHIWNHQREIRGLYED